MTKNIPINLDQLAPYLHANPRIRCTSEHAQILAEDLVFLWANNGGLWFRRAIADEDDTNARSFLPIDCGMTPANTRVQFTGSAFIVTKFGVAITYTYLD